MNNSNLSAARMARLMGQSVAGAGGTMDRFFSKSHRNCETVSFFNRINSLAFHTLHSFTIWL